MPLVALVATTVAVSACGQTSSATRSSQRATTCAAPFIFRTATGGVHSTGNCAGIITAPSHDITLKLGGHLHVAALQDQAAHSHYPIPTATTDVLVLAVSHGASAEYVARHRGTTHLVVRSVFCAHSHRRRIRCSVLTVHVS